MARPLLGLAFLPLVLLLADPARVSGQIYAITTVAGKGLPAGFGGDNGPATGAQLNTPSGVAVDSSGNLYIADSNNNRVRKVSNGVITTVAGGGTSAADNIPATNASITSVSTIALDSAGNLYLAVSGRIRKVSNGVITTVVGGGTGADTGENVPATSVVIVASEIAVDAVGNLYYWNENLHRLRKVANGVITTEAGTGTCCIGTPGFYGDNGPALSADLGGSISGLAVDAAGNLYIADSGTGRVRKITNGVITTVAGGGSTSFGTAENGLAINASVGTQGIAVDSTGTFYFADSQFILKVQNGIINTVGTPLGQFTPVALAVDATGRVYVSDRANDVVLLLTPLPLSIITGSSSAPAGTVGVPYGFITFAATGGAGDYTWSATGLPSGLTLSAGGLLSGTPNVAGSYNPQVTATDLSGSSVSTSTVLITINPASPPVISSLSLAAPTATGAPYILTVNGTGFIQGSQAQWNGTMLTTSYISATLVIASVPAALIVNPGTANIMVANIGGAASNLVPYAINTQSISVPASGQTYTITTIAGKGLPAGFGGDNGPATSAQLNQPSGVVVDRSGNLYIADSNNNRVRRVSNGVITTVAGGGTSTADNIPATNASISGVSAIALDSAGNLYLAASGTIRKVSNGVITTAAGGPRADTGENVPATSVAIVASEIAVDAVGNLYYFNENQDRLRKVANGVITTEAGTGTCCVGTPGFYGDNGPAPSADLGGIVTGLSADSAGNLYIADVGTRRLRKITNGVITTVAGGGSTGFVSAENGLAINASVSPQGIAVDSAGTLYFADSKAIRKVQNGIITTVATPPGTFTPVALAVDAQGRVYVSDRANDVVLLLTPGAASGLTITTSSLPNGTVNQPYGPVTLAATGGSGSYSWSATGVPAGLILSTAGILSGTPATAGSFSVMISVASGGVSASAPLSLTITGGAQSIQVPGGGGASQVILPGGTVSTPYSQLLPASNGNPPYSWSVLGGALPQGLSLGSTGTLSGTPSQAGGALFTARVTDASGAAASSMFSITIAPQSLTITTVSPLPNGIAGSDYPAQVITATGGNPPYTFQTTGGALPVGLALTGGQISGIPTTTGAFNFTVTATDSSSPALMASTPFQLTVQPSHADLILSQASLAFSLNLGATGLPSGDNVSVRSSVASQLLNYSVAVNPAVPWLDVSSGGTTTPGAIVVKLDQKALSLAAGVSPTSVVVTCIAPSPCAGNKQTINVSLTVSAAQPQLAVSSSLLSFSAQTSNPQPVSQTLGVQNVGGGTITVNSITAADSFVTISGVPPTIAAGPAIPVTVTVNPANLTAGYYQSTILVNTSAGLTNVPVTLLLAPNPTMTLSPAGTQFQQTALSSPGNPNGSFLVAVSGGSISWTAVQLPGANWLTLNTASGSSTSANPGTVSFSINQAVAATLPAQTYSGAIQVSSSTVVDSPLTFLVILTVAPAASLALPNPTPAGLLFLSSAGGTPAAQTVQVFTSSATPVTYQASSDSPWLLVSPASGSTSTASAGSSTVSVNIGGLAAGVYPGNVSYALSSAAVRTVNVTLIVTAGAGASDRTNGDRTSKAVTCSPTQLAPAITSPVNNFSQGTAYPTPLSVMLVDNCGNAITSAQVGANFNNGDSPVALAATSSGNYSGTWTPHNISQNLTIKFTAMASGFPSATVQLSGQAAPTAAPLLTSNGTVNASFATQPGAPIAPGTIVAIFGSNLAAQATPDGTMLPLATSLAQTSVMIGGVLAPLYYVSPGQINAQVPFERLTAGNQYQVFVNANGAMSTGIPIQLTADAPGIFQSYAGQVIAQHIANNGAVTCCVTEASPAMPGEYIVFYVAGMGLTNPGVTSGNATPLASLTVLDTATLTLNGAPVPTANILFAGLTPTAVGLYQIDMQVPANAPNGDLQLVLTQTNGPGNSTILPVHN